VDESDARQTIDALQDLTKQDLVFVLPFLRLVLPLLRFRLPFPLLVNHQFGSLGERLVALRKTVESFVNRHPID
jgi:hypothetical protein